MGAVIHLFPESVQFLVRNPERGNIRPTLDKAVESLCGNFTKALSGDENARHTITVIAGYEMEPVLSRLADTLLREIPATARGVPGGTSRTFRRRLTLAEAGFPCDCEPGDRA